MKTADEFIQGIAQSINNAELILFCGAGISCNSGIPMVSPLVNYVLDKLQIPEHEKKLFFKSDLPFEAFVEVLRENSTVDKIFDIYDADKPTINAVKPNSNHFLLAKLVKSGKLKTIVTTNFDQLIERALASGPNPWQENHEYDVLYKEQHFKNIDWNDNRIRLIKIHGSIHDIKSMAITIKQVANKKFSSLRKNVVDYVFSNGSHKSVLILGYSCSDAFDIVPQIKAINGPRKNVFLVEHTTNGSPTVEGIETKKEKNPFKGFDGSRVFLNTDTLVKSLWKEVFKECRKVEKITIPWEKNVDAWCSGVPALIKSKIAGLIFWAISRH
jgi:NAD-dependent SIR2 family protein deacetylase